MTYFRILRIVPFLLSPFIVVTAPRKVANPTSSYGCNYTALLDQSLYAKGPNNATCNGMVVFADCSGTLLKNSSLTLPAMTGAAGTVLESDGHGNLVFGTPAGTGNTSTAMPFTTNNSIVKTDLSGGVNTIQQSGITIDSSNNMSGVVFLNAELINANLTGNVTGSASANILKSGDTMTGTLTLPTGTGTSPSLKFSGSTNTGISTTGVNTLAFSTDGLERMAINGTGSVTISNLNNNGVIHSDSTGTLSTSSITNNDIADGSISNTKLETMASTNTAGALVVRDGVGDFGAHMITLEGETTNPTDVATKAYVDAAVAAGFEVKLPALVVSTTNITLNGMQTIDGISVNPNDRVLLVGQTNTLQNGLWLTQTNNWTRPTDFATSLTPGQTYVLITEGSANAGSSWICTTPTAVIDTEPLTFVEFSIPGQTTATNIGTGTGQLFENKIGINLNFKTIAADNHIVVANNATTVTIATDATNNNTPSTLVSRDGTGNFSATTITANMIGSASANVLLSGDTMSGSLQLPAGTAAAPSLTFTGSTATGLSASAGTLSLNTNGTSQITISPTGLVAIPGLSNAGILHTDALGNLSTSLIINSDIDSAAAITDSKLATITSAGKIANSATTAASSNIANALVARDSSGDFTAGTITATLNGNALSATNAANFAGTLTGDVTGTQSATVVNTVGGQTAATLATAALLANAATNNNTASTIVKRDSNGNFIAGTITANVTGSVTGSASGNVLKTGDTMSGDLQLPAGTASTPSLNFTGNTTTGLSAAGGTLALSTNGTAQVTISPIGTVAIPGFTNVGIVHNDALGTLATSLIVNADISPTATITDSKLATITTAGKIANSATTATNNDIASAIVARDTFGNFVAGTISADLIGDVVGAASANVLKAGDTMTGTLQLPAGTTSAPSLTFTDSTTAGISAATGALSFSTNRLPRLAIASGGAVSINDLTTAGIVHNDLLGTLSTSLIVNADIDPAAAITDSKLATIVSANKIANSATTASSATIANAIVARDAAQNFSANIISATLNGNALSATNAANFTGSLSGDVSGTQSTTAVGTVGGQTSANIAAATLLANAATNANTVSTIVKRDSSGNFAAGTITANLIGLVTGNVTGTVTGSASGNVLKVGDTMTGSLQLPAGTAAAPSLTFTGSTTAGLSASAGTLSLNTNGTSQITISPTGSITLPTLSTAGVVHNNALGGLSTSLIVNADIDPAAAIIDSKLATISTVGKIANSATTAASSNVASALVARDSSGNFAAGTITANLTGNVTGAATTAANFSGTLSGDVSGTQSTTVVGTVGGQTSANIATATVLANGATSIDTVSTLVKRDSLGNFAAGTITASLNGNITGNASGNVLKVGDTMTGTLQLPAGTASSPALTFTGSTTTGFSAPTANTLSIDANGTQVISISSSEIDLLAKVIATNLICNQAIQSAVPANNTTVTVGTTTSLLLLKPTGLVSSNFTITFPANPIHGQRLTIILGNPSLSVSILNDGNGATIINGLAQLSTTLLTALTGGISVTYFYYAPDNAWYREC